MNDMEERDIIKKAANGDEKAFETLAYKYQALIYRLCLSSLKNEDDALDVSQEVIFKIWKSLSSFRFDSSFSTWVYTVTKNAISDFIRKNQKHIGEISIDEENEDGDKKYDFATDDSQKPDETVLQKERSEIIRAAISTLSDEHRSVIILRDIEGYPYSEIAKMLNESEGTVKSRLNRARCKLKEILKKRNFFT